MAEQSLKKAGGGWRGVPRKKVLLLETSSDWIKLIEISSGRSGLEINRATLEPVDAQTVISESLSEALGGKRTGAMPVLVSIPRQLVNVRLLEFPSTDPAEIQDMVELQVGRQTPYSVNEILSGYKALGHTREGAYTRVMLAIAQRSLVRERYYAIEQAGLSVERMTISSEGVVNWFLYRLRAESPEKARILLDVDSFFTHMIVVQHHKVVFTKSILWGAKQAAEGVDAFVSLVQAGLQACSEALREAKVESVTVSGAGVHLEGVTGKLAEALSLPCGVMDCLDDLKPGVDVEKLRDSRYAQVSLTALVGMALAPNLLDFHFVPDVVWLRHLILLRTKVWSALATAAAVVLVAGSLYALLASGYRLRRLETVTGQVEALAPEVVRTERMLEVIRAVRTRQDSRFLPENLIPAVHASIPEGVFLDSLELDIERARFAMAGAAPSRRDIRELIRLLEEKMCFAEVEEGGGTAMDRNERFTFQVVGRLKKERLP